MRAFIFPGRRKTKATREPGIPLFTSPFLLFVMSVQTDVRHYRGEKISKKMPEQQVELAAPSFVCKSMGDSNASHNRDIVFNPTKNTDSHLLKERAGTGMVASIRSRNSRQSLI
jgi:hypothetical protein